ncbi:ABC transporter ATP-binding protein [Geobacter sp. DSM 9736]|uniref:ABC transporter ATP-binding protein n=1 Tax=Geobacter sp. DSM 9736 TaxID=1277350 RepID=UPI000B5055A1|nr:ABC transporter ATP-binding protein [Geobacter sp. DSM 9736]SNB45950.1 tungstate transport system ATP-binding protein [Geobacter sp. DSM 9736]
MTAPHLLEASELEVVRGGVRVLSVPSFVLGDKEVVSLVGPNGAGKSTFLLALARLLPVASGQIRCRGEAISSDRATFAYRRRMAMVFQEPLLFDGTVFDNVAAGLKIRKFSRKEIAARVAETLELFDISYLAERSARKLSGGEAQRTSLARAFAIRPDIIFLDEPFSALDPPTRQALTEDLAHILTKTSTSAVLATHDQLEAIRLSDRMVVMNNGRIVQTGTPFEIMNRPVDQFVATFVGMENMFEGDVVETGRGMLTVELGGQRVQFPGSADPGDTALFCIRPEHVTITTTDTHGSTSARNVIPAFIGGTSHAGVFDKVSLDCGFPLVAYVTSQSFGDLHLEKGTAVFASFKAAAVHLMHVTKKNH